MISALRFTDSTTFDTTTYFRIPDSSYSLNQIQPDDMDSYRLEFLERRTRYYYPDGVIPPKDTATLYIDLEDEEVIEVKSNHD